MGIPIKRLQREIDSETFALYMAYDNLNPVGEERSDYRNAINTQWTVAAMTGKMLEIETFIPKFGLRNTVENRSQTPEQMLMIAKQITAVMNRNKG